MEDRELTEILGFSRVSTDFLNIIREILALPILERRPTEENFCCKGEIDTLTGEFYTFFSQGRP